MLANSSPKFVHGQTSALDSSPVEYVPAGTANEWALLVERIRRDDAEAANELYVNLGGLKGYFRRHLGPDGADDSYHTLMINLLRSIRQDSINQPERLAAYATVMAHRMVVDHMRAAMQRREFLERSHVPMATPPCAEEDAIKHEAWELAAKVLGALSVRDRSVLTRFYVQEESPSQIQSDLGLTATQFRLIKSRAKTRFLELARLRIGPRRASRQREHVA